MLKIKLNALGVFFNPKLLIFLIKAYDKIYFSRRLYT